MRILPLEFKVIVESPWESSELYKRALNAILDALSDVMGSEAGADELMIKVEKENECRTFGVYNNLSGEIIGYIEVYGKEDEKRAEIRVIISV